MNVIYYAVSGVDERGAPDLTCTELILLIATNCHSIIMSENLIERYIEHIQWLQRKPTPALPPLRVWNELIVNSQKAVWEKNAPPDLPQGVRVPQNDMYIVRAALASRPWVVTCDNTLAQSIREQPLLGLHAIRPTEALKLAQDT